MGADFAAMNVLVGFVADWTIRNTCQAVLAIRISVLPNTSWNPGDTVSMDGPLTQLDWSNLL